MWLGAFHETLELFEKWAMIEVRSLVFNTRPAWCVYASCVKRQHQNIWNYGLRSFFAPIVVRGDNFTFFGGPLVLFFFKMYLSHISKCVAAGLDGGLIALVPLNLLTIKVKPRSNISTPWGATSELAYFWRSKLVNPLPPIEFEKKLKLLSY